MGILLTCLLVIIPLATAPWVFKKTQGRLIERILVSLVPLGAGLSIWVSAYTIAIATMDDWSGAKVAPIVAMVRGSPDNYALYQDPNSGVMTGWIYGPVAAILLLPAAVFSTPTNIILAANVMNLLWVMIPVFWFHVLASRGWNSQKRRRWTIALLGTCAFLWICLPAEFMARSLFMAGADGPAMGLAALSIAFISSERRIVRVALSAICAVLAVWSKQSILPFLIVAPVHIFLVDGTKAMLKYLAILAATIIAITLPLLLVFGGGNMWFHMFTLPSAHPWTDQEKLGRPLILLRAAGEVVNVCGVAVCMLLFVAVLLSVLGDDAARPSRSTWRLWIVQNPWLMLIAAALMVTPGAIVGYVKVGGFVNNLGLTNFFLVLAATLWATQLIVEMRSARAVSLLRSSLCALILAEAALPVFWDGKMPELTAYIAGVYNNRAEEAYRFARQHPGVGYFPWDPLPSLLAEGKLYHFEWGIIDTALAGRQDVPHFQKHLPDRISKIAYPRSAQSRFVLQYLPNVRDNEPDLDLPDFAVFTEGGGH